MFDVQIDVSGHTPYSIQARMARVRDTMEIEQNGQRDSS